MNGVLQVVMERSFWMYNLSRLDPSYITEVQRFIDAAQNHASRTRHTYIVHAWIVEILLYLMTFNKSLLIWSVEDL